MTVCSVDPSVRSIDRSIDRSGRILHKLVRVISKHQQRQQRQQLQQRQQHQQQCEGNNGTDSYSGGTTTTTTTTSTLDLLADSGLAVPLMAFKVGGVLCSLAEQAARVAFACAAVPCCGDK